MGFAQDRVGLGLGSPGEQEHSNKLLYCCRCRTKAVGD